MNRSPDAIRKMAIRLGVSLNKNRRPSAPARRLKAKGHEVLSAMEYPHWMMVAGAWMVVAGLAQWHRMAQARPPIRSGNMPRADTFADLWLTRIKPPPYGGVATEFDDTTRLTANVSIPIGT